MVIEYGLEGLLKTVVFEEGSDFFCGCAKLIVIIEGCAEVLDEVWVVHGSSVFEG